jgi:hypothetical protein
MISWTITVPPTVGTAQGTDSASQSVSYTYTNIEFLDSEQTLAGTDFSGAFSSSSAGAGGSAILANGNTTASGSGAFGFSETLADQPVTTETGSTSGSESGATTTSWNGSISVNPPLTYEEEADESVKYTSTTQTSAKQTTQQSNFTVAVDTLATLPVSWVSGTTRTTEINSETLTIATTTTTQAATTGINSTQASGTQTVLVPATQASNSSAIVLTTSSDTVTAYGYRSSGTTYTGPDITPTIAGATTTTTFGPTNTGFRHTATVAIVGANEVLWELTTNGTGMLSDLCASHGQGTHTILPKITRLQPVQGNPPYLDTYETTLTTATTSTTSSTQTTLANGNSFPAQTASVQINKARTTTTQITKTLSTYEGPIESTTVWTTATTMLSLDGQDVFSTIPQTSEITFSKAYGAQTLEEGFASGFTTEPWTFLKMTQAVMAQGQSAYQSNYLSGRAAPNNLTAVGQNLRAVGLTFTADTALAQQTAIAPFPTSWTYTQGQTSGTISLGGGGASRTTQDESTFGTTSGAWQIEGGTTHEFVVAAQIAVGGKPPKGNNISLLYPPGVYFTSNSTGQSGIEEVTELKTSSAPVGDSRTARMSAPVFVGGWVTAGGGLDLFTTARNAQATIATDA